MESTSSRQRYSVSIADPDRHLARIDLQITECTGDELVVRMAAWCPGSYLVRDYARYLRQLSARDGDGNALPLTKVSKQSWAIATGGAKTVSVSYQVYGFDLSVRTNHIDATHAFLHGPATYLYVDERRHGPATVSISLPAGSGSGQPWSITTGLRRDPAGDPEHFVAANLDELFDCPLHLGEIEHREFIVANVPFELAVWGVLAPAKRGLDELVADLIPILSAHTERFGGLPFDRYSFILMLAPKAYGGLEHKNSSANLASSHAFAKETTYHELLELLSHEFFHVWNGKRIFPAALTPFDYTSENYTRCLWVMEGLTSFFDRYTVLRSGPLAAKRYLEKLAEEWGQLQSIPGRHLHSLEDASFDAWIKLYKPDPSNLNTTVSYYLKGGLVAATLDLWIRRNAGDRSLADVMSALWSRFGATGEGHPENVQGIFSEATGLDLSEPFDRWIRGTEDPSLPEELAHLGLALGEREDESGPSTYLGVRLGEQPLRVAAVMDDSPALEAGLSPGDELVAIDAFRVNSSTDVRRSIVALAPGDTVELTVFRHHRLTTTRLKLAQTPTRRFQIATTTTPTESEKARFSDWLGEAWPSAQMTASASPKPWT